MGTYTTNYNLFLPTIGEQGWGTLVNGNFSTIDTAMSGLNIRIGTLEIETDTVANKVSALEPLLAIEVDENQNVTFPGNVNINGRVYEATPTLDFDGYMTFPVAGSTGFGYGEIFTIFTSPFPISGRVSVRSTGNVHYGKLVVIGTNGLSMTDVTGSEKIVAVTNAFTISAIEPANGSSLVVGIPKLVYN